MTAPHPRVLAPRVSFVVPAYDEQGNIAPLCAGIRDVMGREGHESWELVIVDDGSTDATAREVKEEIARDARVRLVSLARNTGLSTALEAGIRRSTGAIVVMMDADLQCDPADIPRFLAELDRCDCVAGYRARRSPEDGVVKRASSAIANHVRRRVTGSTIRDAGCTFRAVRRECLERVKLWKGMHRFLPTLLELEGYRVREIPINHRPRLHGVSKYGLWNRVFTATRDLLAVRWMISRVVRYEIKEEA